MRVSARLYVASVRDQIIVIIDIDVDFSGDGGAITSHDSRMSGCFLFHPFFAYVPSDSGSLFFCDD